MANAERGEKCTHDRWWFADCEECGIEAGEQAAGRQVARLTEQVATTREALRQLLELAEQISRGFPPEAEVWFAVRDHARAVVEGGGEG